MRSKLAGHRMLGLLIGIVGLTALLVAACSSDPTATPQPTATTAPTAMPEPTATTAAPKEAIKLYSSNWTSIELNTRIPGYILENGYQYPIEYVTGVTGTMKVALPIGEMHVVMEVWRQNIYDWYEEHIDAGNIVDLAGTGESLPNGSKGQILENSAQGFYVPQYVVDENPGLVSVSDLPDYVELFPDPEDPSKGLSLQRNHRLAVPRRSTGPSGMPTACLTPTTWRSRGRPERLTPAYRALTTPLSLSWPTTGSRPPLSMS